MKKYIGVLFISMMLFCTSCRLSSDNTSSAALSAPAVPYQEEKTPCQRKFPYADFSETYGTLLNYFTDTASGDAIFLYRGRSFSFPCAFRV